MTKYEVKTKYRFIKPKRHIHSIFLHCSATDHIDHDNAEFIRSIHVQENGWRDIGYHYFINKDGNLFKCRDLKHTPAAQQDNNTGTIAICLSGLNEFTDAQFETLEELLRKTQEAYGSKRLRIRGHTEVSNKSCPVFDYAAILNLHYEGSDKKRAPIYYLRRERLMEKPEAKGVAAVAVIGGTANVAELLKDVDLSSIASQVQSGTAIASSVSSIINIAPLALGIMALAAIGYVFYAIWKRHEKETEQYT